MLGSGCGTQGSMSPPTAGVEEIRYKDADGVWVEGTRTVVIVGGEPVVTYQDTNGADVPTPSDIKPPVDCGDPIPVKVCGSVMIDSAGSVPVEEPFLATIPLGIAGDSVVYPADVFTSAGFYVKAGSVEVSLDGGATFVAIYDSTDPSVVWGQGHEGVLDVSEVEIKALEDNTVVQLIGDRIL